MTYEETNLTILDAEYNEIYGKEYKDNSTLSEWLEIGQNDVERFEVFVTPLYDGNIDDDNFKPSLSQTKSIINQLNNGLKQLKAAEKSHNDLKPANILYRFENNSYEVKISDFGQTSKNGGTPGWTAPVFKDRQPGKEDVYSMGLVYLRLLCESKDLFKCLRDNYIHQPGQWLTDFRNLVEVQFVMELTDLKNIPTIENIQNAWAQIQSKVQFITKNRLRKIGVPDDYLEIQNGMTK